MRAGDDIECDRVVDEDRRADREIRAMGVPQIPAVVDEAVARMNVVAELGGDRARNEIDRADGTGRPWARLMDWKLGSVRLQEKSIAVFSTPDRRI